MNLADQADRDRAETIPCPLLGCSAPTGTTCLNLTTRQPLEHQPAHHARLRAAGVVHAPLDSRDLAARHERTPR